MLRVFPYFPLGGIRLRGVSPPTGGLGMVFRQRASPPMSSGSSLSGEDS